MIITVLVIILSASVLFSEYLVFIPFLPFVIFFLGILVLILGVKEFKQEQNMFMKNFNIAAAIIFFVISIAAFINN
jgi:hypothetical protein